MRNRQFGLSLLALSLLLGVAGCDSSADSSGKPADASTPEAKKTDDFVNKGDYKAIMAKNKGKMGGAAPAPAAK